MSKREIESITFSMMLILSFLRKHEIFTHTHKKKKIYIYIYMYLYIYLCIYVS